jgi:cytidine deaminase
MCSLETLAIKKARQSICRYKISAIGINAKGEVIGKSCNFPRFYKKCGGIHAEMNLMWQKGPALHTIFICRINKRGDILPIDPCPMCKGKADELGIKIRSIYN